MGVLIDALFAKHIYDILKYDSKDMDAIYEDYILHMVGTIGLFALKEYKLVETCGVVGGRQLYTLLAPTAISLK